MEKTRIMLTIEHQLQSQLLVNLLAEIEQVEIVGEASEVIDILGLIETKKPHLWIHSWELGDDLEGVLSHVHSERSDMAVIRMASNELTGFLHFQINSLAELLRLAQNPPGMLISA